MTLMAALALAACGGGSHGAASTTTPTSISTTSPLSSPTSQLGTTTTATIDVATVPAQITVPYINAVFAALNHVEGNVVRSILATHTIPRVDPDSIKAIYSPAQLNQQLMFMSQVLTGDQSNIRPNPGDGVTTVNELLKATPTCIFVETTTDASAVVFNVGQKAVAEYYALEPKRSVDDPTSINPTPWAIAAEKDFVSTPYSVPLSPC